MPASKLHHGVDVYLIQGKKTKAAGGNKSLSKNPASRQLVGANWGQSRSSPEWIGFKKQNKKKRMCLFQFSAANGCNKKHYYTRLDVINLS